MAKGKSEESPAELAQDIEETRDRLAGTIDELLYRAHPKTIVSREVSSVKAHYVDPATGQPRTDNILKTVGGVVGAVVLFDPEDKAEVEVNAEVYVVLRERDVHAVAADRLGEESTGLYL